MQASDDIEDNWEQLLRELGKAAQHRLVSDKHGRSAAIIQLRAILTFLDQTGVRADNSFTYSVWRVGRIWTLVPSQTKF